MDALNWDISGRVVGAGGASGADSGADGSVTGADGSVTGGAATGDGTGVSDGCSWGSI